MARGDVKTGRELETAAKAAQTRAERLERRTNLKAGLRLTKRLEAVEVRLNTLDGCNRSCQAKKNRAQAKEYRCSLAHKSSIGVDRADELCTSRFFKGELLDLWVCEAEPEAPPGYVGRGFKGFPRDRGRLRAVGLCGACRPRLSPRRRRSTQLAR